jgi:formate dehydrogenase gamma subunit
MSAALFSHAVPNLPLLLASVFHLAVGLLRVRHRCSRFLWRPVVLVSLMFATLPWFFPTSEQLTIGAGVNLVWLLASALTAPARREERVAAATRRRPTRPAVTVAAPRYEPHRPAAAAAHREGRSAPIATAPHREAQPLGPGAARHEARSAAIATESDREAQLGPIIDVFMQRLEAAIARAPHRGAQPLGPSAARHEARSGATSTSPKAPLAKPSNLFLLPLEPPGFVSTLVFAVLDEPNDVRVLRIVRPKGFDAEPGQSLTIGIRTNGQGLTQDFLIRSASPSCLEISVRRQGPVAEVLHPAALVGSFLSLRLPAPRGVAPTPVPAAANASLPTLEAAPAPRGAELRRFPRSAMARDILRFRRSEILFHWSIAIPFMACFTTGLILKVFYDLDSESISRHVFAWLHRTAGACMIVFPILAVLRNWRDYGVHLHNVRQAWTWKIEDLKWLVLIGPAALTQRVALPEERKFNAGEKLNFMMVMCTWPVFVTTGLFLWMPGVWFVPYIVHVISAVLATPLVLGHIFLAAVNPGTRVGLTGMVSGRVDRQWAKHHYRRWYRENFEEDGTPKR